MDLRRTREPRYGDAVRLLLLSAFVFAACGTPDIDASVTISQGVYGQLTKRCDGAGCAGDPLSGAPVAWFDSAPWSTDGGADPIPRQETTSGSNGLYQFAIDSNVKGYVAIGQRVATSGTTWVTATAVTVPKGLARVDWQGGNGNEGTWTQVK